MHTLTAKPRDYRIISLDEFLNLTEEDKSNIRQVRIVPPDFDDGDFGYMQVFYKSPIYEVELSDGREAK